MFLNQKRIVNVDNVLLEFKQDEEVIIMLNHLERFEKLLKEIGFQTIEDGNSVLPTVKGSVSRHNANGIYKLLRDLPKETYTISRDILAFGKYDTTATFYHKRFQRELIDAPSQELYIDLDKDNKKFLSAFPIKMNEKNKPLIKHTINLFLEIFKECQVVDKNLISRVKTSIIRLNWNLLPKGKMSWEELEKYLEKNINEKSTKKKQEIYARINYINSFEPDFIATGNGGFNDYIVLGLADKNLYILENRKPQNATYIFEKNWEDLTKLTKAEILKEKLQKRRLIHTENWKLEIKKILT